MLLQRHFGSPHSGLISSRSIARLPSNCFFRSRTYNVVVRASVSEQAPGKTIVVKNQSGDLPFPWSEKDPYKLPVSIDRVQKLLASSGRATNPSIDRPLSHLTSSSCSSQQTGWEKPWVEQIVDRIMKGMLRTTEERCKAVLDYLTSIGLKQDEICNMASISVVLLGLNPETRLKPIVSYLQSRGVPDASIPDLLLKHPRIVEYTIVEGQPYVSKLKARIQVDVVPPPPGSSEGTLPAAAVNYYREGAAFLVSPVSPSGPLDAAAIAALSAARS